MSIKAVIAAMTIKVKVLIACAAVVVIGGTAAAVGITMTKEDTYRVLKVFEMTGEATVNRESSGELAAYVGMNLESGDLISVGEGSTIRLSLDGDKYIQLDELTVLELEATGTQTDSRTVIKLKEGTILNEITKPLSENSIYEVATPKATMAVRGTSFSVTVTKDTEGKYIITENTYHGKVEAILLDESGAPTSKTAIVNADRSITICTSPNEETGNPAEIDGTSVFVVYDTETGEMQIVPDGEDPTHDIDYELISAIVKEYALRSNDTNLMTLDENIVHSLRGNAQKTDSPADTGTDGTTAPAQTELSETTVPESTVSEVDDEPINSDNTDNAVEAAAPIEEDSPADNADTAASETAAADESTTAASTTTAEESTTTAGTTTAEESTTTAGTTTAEESTTTAGTTTAEESTTAASTTTAENTTTTANTTTASTTTASTTTASTTTAVTEPPQTTTTAATTAETIDTTAPETSDTEVTTEETEEVPESFEITFKCDGEIVKTVSAELDDSLYNIVSSVPVPEKEGKTGVWKINGITSVTSDMTVAENITLEAVYSTNTYTVTFVADGADEAAPKPIEALYGDSLYDIVSACEIPAKTGYKGIWLVNGAPVTEGMTVTKDVTVTAVYSIQKLTVYFSAPDADDSTTVPSPVEVDYGTALSKVVPANVPAKTGHTGVWKINGTADISADTAVKADITVKAVYTPIKYTVTFDAAGADDETDIPAAAEYDYGTLLSEIVPADVPEKTGHTGVWKINGTTDISADSFVDGDITVKAVYTANKYTVTFDASGADDETDIPAAAEYDYGTLLSEIVPADVPEKTGNTGVWLIDGTTDITADAIVEADITVKAVYTPIKYTVSFDASGADDETDIPAAAEYDYGTLLSEIVPADVPEKTGHTGVWKINGTTDISADSFVDGDITVKAVYTANKYTVTFDASGADDETDIPAAAEYDYGTLLSEIVPADVPEKTGHTGVWLIDGTTDITTDAIVEADITVKAVYTPIKYTVTFDASGADDETDIPAAAEYDYGTLLSEIVPADVPEKTGHTGVWKIDGTTDISADSFVDGDITVKAVYTANKYTVTFDASGADDETDIPAAAEYDYGTLLSEIVPADVPEKTGHTGVWLIDGTTDITADAIVEADITVKAVYTPIKYTITFDAPDADASSDVPVPVEAEYGSLLKDAVTADVPEKTGHTGVWKINGTTDITDEMTVTGDITLTAVYTINKYTVTFTADDANDPTRAPAPIEAEYGTLFKDIVTAAVPAKTGHTGVWKIDGTTVIDDTAFVSEDTTVSAVYTAIKYTITFTAPEADDQSTVPAAVKAAYGTLLKNSIPAKVPAKAGHDGVWKIDGTTAITSTTKVTKNITVTAVYTMRDYVTISYNFNGTTGTVQGNKGEDLKSQIIPNKIQKQKYDNDLMNPYAWLTYNDSWREGANGNAGKVDSGMLVDDYVIKQDEVEVWSAKKHTVSYTVGSTTGKFYLADNESIMYIYDGFLDDILNGYKGFLNPDGTEFTNTSTVSADTTITAYKYKVTLEYADGTVKTYYFAENESFTDKYNGMPTPDANIGYEATGWKDKETGTVISTGTVITSDMTLVPNQSEKTYSVTFSIPNGSDSTPVEKSYSSVILDSAPSPDDFVYNAWFVGETKLDSTTTISELISSGVISEDAATITVTAGGDTSVNYTVTFTADKADNPSAAPSPVELAYGTKLAEYLEGVTVPKKSGSDGEWKISGTNDTISADYIVHKDITVAADYTQRTSVTVNYTFNGTTGSVQGNEGERLLTNIIPKIDTTSYANELMNPYIWITRNSSWYSDRTGNVQVESGMEVTNYVLDQDSVSVWTENKHTVSYTVGSKTGKFYVADGYSVNDYDSSFLSGLLGDYRGFLDSDGNAFTKSTTISADTSITAYKYTVTLMQSSNSFQILGTYYFAENESFNSKGVSMPAPPAKLGYKATGWRNSDDITITANTIIDSDMTLYPVQEKIPYTVIFKIPNGSGGYTETTKTLYVDSVVLDSAPSLTGTSYTKWRVNGTEIGDTVTLGTALSLSNISEDATEITIIAE